MIKYFPHVKKLAHGTTDYLGNLKPNFLFRYGSKRCNSRICKTLLKDVCSLCICKFFFVVWERYGEVRYNRLITNIHYLQLKMTAPGLQTFPFYPLHTYMYHYLKLFPSGEYLPLPSRKCSAMTILNCACAVSVHSSSAIPSWLMTRPLLSTRARQNCAQKPIKISLRQSLFTYIADMFYLTYMRSRGHWPLCLESTWAPSRGTPTSWLPVQRCRRSIWSPSKETGSSLYGLYSYYTRVRQCRYYFFCRFKATKSDTRSVSVTCRFSLRQQICILSLLSLYFRFQIFALLPRDKNKTDNVAIILFEIFVLRSCTEKFMHRDVHT